MTQELAEKKRAAHELVDQFFDAGRELMILPISPELPDDSKPALALHLVGEIQRFQETR